ncbi:MAG: hypothetical protein Q9210_001198 [Variospora velana]
MVVGHYKAENFDHNKNTFLPNPDISVLVTVDEVFDNDHRVVNTKGSATGKFTFSAADAGDHRICFLPSVPGGGGWLSGGQTVDGMRMTLDLAIGETSQIESTDKGKILDIVSKVKDLNGRLQDIRREQVFQRTMASSALLIAGIATIEYYLPLTPLTPHEELAISYIRRELAQMVHMYT